MGSARDDAVVEAIKAVASKQAMIGFFILISPLR
jgi:hypothetical protein